MDIIRQEPCADYITPGYRLPLDHNLYYYDRLILRDVVKIIPDYNDLRICAMDKYNRIYRIVQESPTYIGDGTLTDDGYFMGSCYFLFGTGNYRQIDLVGDPDHTDHTDQICATDAGYYVKPKSQSYVKISPDGYLRSANDRVLLKISSHHYNRQDCVLTAITKSY